MFRSAIKLLSWKIEKYGLTISKMSFYYKILTFSQFATAQCIDWMH